MAIERLKASNRRLVDGIGDSKVRTRVNSYYFDYNVVYHFYHQLTLEPEQNLKPNIKIQQPKQILASSKNNLAGES